MPGTDALEVVVRENWTADNVLLLKIKAEEEADRNLS